MASTRPQIAHSKRIQTELKKAGVTKYGLLKIESRHLPEIIHDDEHIHGVVYGRHESGSAMLVATDKRVLFLDHKPLFRLTDEISYEMVGGVRYNRQGRFAAVVLHTRVGDYSIRFVNITCASLFVKFIEARSVEHSEEETIPKLANKSINTKESTVSLPSEVKVFLASHNLATLSSISREGNVHGAAVYYVIDKNDYIYVVTKSQTQKAQNIIAHNQVALTIFDTQTMQTLQLSGLAHVEHDPVITEDVYRRILHPRLSGKDITTPPILHVPAGEYMVIVIKPSTYNFSDFKR